MWVIYNAETGYEIDSVEHYRDAKELRTNLNKNEFGNRYEMRWEER